MIAAPRCLRAAGTVLILASVSMAGDTSGVAINSDRTAADLSRNERPGHDARGLETRRPYERGKIPVVLIHGLWGNPDQWDRMVKELEADPVLQCRYQFWTFGYASGDSIPYSAHMLRQSLRRARRGFDPAGTDAAWDRMVVVGHSLGGILAKMMTQSSGSRLWQTISDRPPSRIAGRPEDCRLIQEAFCYESLPEVRRIVFINTPHRGSPVARGPWRGLGVKLCLRPNSFRNARELLLASNEPDFFVPGFRSEDATSVGELASGHPLLEALCDLGIDPSVRSHSIITDLRNPPGPGGSDGIVPYSSSHLECADSETLIHGPHGCLASAALIPELRRILEEHAGINPASRSDRGKLTRDGQESAREKTSGAVRFRSLAP